MGKTEEHKEKKYLIIDDDMIDKLLDKIKEIIDIEKFDDTQILIDNDDKLAGDITLKNAVILMASVMKDDVKFYPQIFSDKNTCSVKDQWH